jgi:transcriptional regulator with XRE-family HTH domain
VVDAGDHNGQEQQQQQQRAQFGAVLAQRRREKGLSLRDVEQATKIRTRYLEGLEREDYSVLPDAVYVQGFLKTYANFLGLDGEQLSRELKEGRRAPRRERQVGGHEGLGESEFEQPLISPGDLGAAAERRRISGTTLLTAALAVLVLAAVIGLLYFVGRGTQTAERPAEEPAGQEEPAKGPAAGPEKTGAGGRVGETADVTTPQAIRATVRVASGSTGLTIRADGTVVLDQVAQPDFSQTFEARDSLRVEATDGGNVEVEINGQNLGRLASSGQPVTRDFTPQSPEVTTRAPS